MARPTKDRAIERLRKVLNEIPELKTLPSDSPEFKKWHRNAQVAITNTFGSKSSHVADFNKIDYFLMICTTDTPDSEFQAAYVRGLESAASVFESMIEEIEEYWEEEQSPKTSYSGVKTPKSTNKVFVIHGRDEGTKNMVARFLEKLGLKPVILHEQPNEGRTIIEKFEDHADVGFAVTLLTPDDAGLLQGDKNSLKPRARQNVIFEFGYFIGKLGREQVCALVKGDVEKPSDYDGVLYIPLDDSDGWQMRLIKELKSAGFEVDANKAISP